MLKINQRWLKSRGGLILLLSIFLGILLLITPIYNTIALYLHAMSALSVEPEKAPVQRMMEDAIQAIAKLRRSMLASKQPGLPTVRIYVPERAQLALIADPPHSISDWQKGALVYPNGKLRNIKIRHRGDSNPVNYSLTKKSWRIKTKRRALFQGRRIFNYVAPQMETMVEEAVLYWMARRIGILAPRVRLIELFVNDVSQGIYNEIENLDEIFLRANNIMPVNIYKGDRDKDSMKGFARYLARSPVIWSKIAQNNRYQADDRDDLERFFDLVRNAASNDDDFQQLRRVAPYQIWAKFSAFQILAQSWHSGYGHNMRLVSDDQNGTMQPIPWDTGGSWAANGFIKDTSSSALLSLYNRNSEFLYTELETLYQHTVEQRLLTGASKFIEKLREKYSYSLDRDTGRLQVLPLDRALTLLFDPKDTLSVNTEMQKSLLNRERWLSAILTQQPKAIWNSQNRSISLMISGPIPLNKLTLQLDGSMPPPTILAYDSNGNQRLDDGDIILPFRMNDNDLTIEAVWLANRILQPKKDQSRGGDILVGWNFDIRPTRFNLISDRPMQILSVSGRSALTGKITKLAKHHAQTGSNPTRYNRPVIGKSVSVPNTWRGKRHITGITVIDHPTRIEAGTHITMGPGASLIFRANLIVAGSAERPVRISSATDNPWGTFALLGPGTQGSHLQHIKMEDGSGANHDGIAYLAMLSIHNTKDIIVSGLTMRRNHLVDDMLHIVYGKEIHLKNLDLADAKYDAIDIDISDVVIRDSRITNSGNDCIDFMTSNALIENVELKNCDDKGISIGEASTTALVNSVVSNSKIGVEVKDASTIQILHSDFLGNEVQINAYKKNWMYAKGGRAVVLKSYFASPSGPNTLKSDKKSSVEIHDSSLLGGTNIDKQVGYYNLTELTGVRQPKKLSYGQELLPLLKSVKLEALGKRRGASAR